MNTLHEAAQQALEALEKYQQMMMAEAGCRWGGGDAAITALKAALAQEQDAPTVKESLQAEPATTQQPADEAPPSDYRRGYWAGFAIGKREGRIEAEDAALKAQEKAEPIAWLQPKTVDGYSRPDLGYETCSKNDYGAFPVYRVPPKTEPVQEPQTLDDAMRLPRAMAEAYENGYKAGQTHERERIIQFLTEMQRQVGDGHNHYGVAAMRIRERV